ncbi:MAG: hypothetical protein ACI4E1_09935 [Lachnospira sp.]
MTNSSEERFVMRYTALFIKGLLRRKREVFRIFLASFLSVFFICGMLLFQENMYQWQIAENYMQFGRWFVMERGEEPSEELVSNENLCEPVKATSYVHMFNKNWKKTGVYLGTMTDEFIESEGLRLEKGRLPQTADEIALDWNSLEKLGYSGKLGQTIKIKYYVNDNKSERSPMREAEYTLTGVFYDYSEIWMTGKYIPGGVITEEAAKKLEAHPTNVWCYNRTSPMKDEDYNSEYNSMTKNITRKVFYNSAVYDFKPWGPDNIYNYIYFMIMIIGVSALCYQIIGYQHNRNSIYRKQRLIGATRGQILGARSMENAVILAISGALGIGLMLVIGIIVGRYLGNEKGIQFFTITGEVILKSILSIVIAIVISELIIVYFTVRMNGVWTAAYGRMDKIQKTAEKSAKKRENSYGKKRGLLSGKNINREIRRRFSLNTSKISRIGVRLFSLTVCIAIVFCGVNIVSAFKDYKEVEAIPDVVGFEQNLDAPLSYFLPITTEYLYSDTKKIEGEYIVDKKPIEYYMSGKTDDLTKEEWITGINEEDSGNNSWQYKVFYGWHKRYNENGKLIKDDRYWNDYKDTDRFEVTKMLITNGKVSKNGNSSCISGINTNFIDKLESIKGVDNISFASYDTMRRFFWEGQDYNEIDIRFIMGDVERKVVSSDTYLYATEFVDPTKELYEKISKYIDSDKLDYDSFARGDQIVLFLDKTPLDHYDTKIKSGDILNWGYYMIPLVDISNGSSSESDAEPLPYWNTFLEKYSADVIKNATKNTQEYLYDMMYGSCISSEIAGVVYIDDEIREEMGELIPGKAFYTALASKNLGEKAVQKQNKLMANLLGVTMDDLPSALKSKFMYNQINVQFGLSSSFSATNNVLTTYCNSNNIIYNSNVNQKEERRTKALDSLLQYGFTVIAVTVIDIIIYTILIKNRLENRKKKYSLLKLLGKTNSGLSRIALGEIALETIWCIFTMPLQMLIAKIIVSKFMKEL